MSISGRPIRRNRRSIPAMRLGYKGEKTFEQPLIASKPGAQTLPALTFSYFDPTTRRYETARSAPLSVTISPSLADSALTAPQVAASGSAGTRESSHRRIAARSRRRWKTREFSDTSLPAAAVSGHPLAAGAGIRRRMDGYAAEAAGAENAGARPPPIEGDQARARSNGRRGAAPAILRNFSIRHAPPCSRLWPPAGSWHPTK